MPHRDDPSWASDRVPAPLFGDRAPVGWEDLCENDFIAYRFRADVELTIGGHDFSTVWAPVVDFALAWQYLPAALKNDDRVETCMTVEPLVYRVENDGAEVAISSNQHKGRVSVSAVQFGVIVDRIVDAAFDLLYERQPALLRNRYLVDLRRRIGLEPAPG
ncbi:hypothetical protein [Nocardia sp. NPDC051750]|uniref:hypothetical protein n=1 Tax=Nocardia sp. NPDC051750 TaxID=3364325 RepID=UPI0037936DDA